MSVYRSSEELRLKPHVSVCAAKPFWVAPTFILQEIMHDANLLRVTLAARREVGVDVEVEEELPAEYADTAREGCGVEEGEPNEDEMMRGSASTDNHR